MSPTKLVYFNLYFVLDQYKRGDQP